MQRDRHLTFEDSKANTGDPGSSVRSTQEWLDMVAVSKDYASQSGATSYSGTSGFDGMPANSPSTLSNFDSSDPSLASSSLPYRHNILRKPVQAGEDDESAKGLKRFSKRHSKNGLAAVF